MMWSALREELKLGKKDERKSVADVKKVAMILMTQKGPKKKMVNILGSMGYFASLILFNSSIIVCK